MKKKPEINKDLMKKEYIEARRLAISEASKNLIKYMQYVTVNDDGLLTYHTGFPEVLDTYLKTLSMCQVIEFTRTPKTQELQWDFVKKNK